ncbi:MAG: DNA polymerase III subunit delta [Verrucomicrobiota bacterium]
MPGYLAIIAGRDEYLVDRDGRACFEKARKAAGSDAEAEVITGQIIRVEDARPLEIQFTESVKTVSMFGGKRVIWLRNFNLVADTVQAKSEDAKESLANMLKVAVEADPSVSIVISATPYDGRRKDLANLKSVAHDFILHASPSKGPFDKGDAQADAQVALAVERFKALGVKHERGVPEVIVGRVGQSTRLVLGECDKLATYVGPGGTVKEADVHLLVPTFGEGDFFEPIEALAARDLRWGLESLDRYFFNEDSSRPLLAALQNRLRLLVQIRCLADSGDFRVSEAGLPKGQFEAASGRHGPTFGSAAKSSANLFSQNAWYVSNKVAPAAARYTLAELVDLQLACADCFDASNRGEDEPSVRAMFLRALAVKRPA